MALNMDDVPTLGVGDAAARIGTSPGFVRRAIDRGEIAHYRIGRLIRVHEDDVAAYLKSARRAAKEDDVAAYLKSARRAAKQA